MSMAEFLELIRRINTSKRFDRLRKRYGQRIAWNEMELEFGVAIFIPMYIRNELSGYRCGVVYDEVPPEYQSLWLELNEKAEAKKRELYCE